jgi:hypothetical protein
MRISAKWLPVLVAPAVMLGVVTAAPGAAASQGVINSPNWAGYAAVAKPGGAVTAFKYVQATFTVPVLNCTSSPSAVSQEVLVGGSDFNGARIVESCQNATPSYGAFGVSTCNGHNDPMYPTLTISPGDTIKLAASSNGLEAAYDLTTGASADNPLATDCLGGPIAGVLTATDASPAIANFTQAGFRQIQVQGSTQKSPQPLVSSAWNVSHYVLQGPSGRADVKPEALLSGTFTSAFANDWSAPN